MELENRDAELEELLEKYGASGRRTQGRQITPDRTPSTRLRRFMSRDEDLKLSMQKSVDYRSRAVLGENQSQRRPSPIRHEVEPEEAWKPRVTVSPISAVRAIPRSPITSREAGESKAFSMAMKALQDRVKFLEGENARLQEERGRGLRLQTAADSFEVEQCLREQTERIASLSAEIKDKAIALAKAEKERKELADELRHAKELIDRFHAEQYRRPDRVLEARCHSLEDQNSAQKAEIAHLRRELDDLRRGERQREEAGFFTPKGRSRTQEVPKDEDIGRCVATEGDYLESTRTAYFGEGDEEKREGFTTHRLERDFNEYNQQYKSLLQQCQDPQTDLSALRSELNAVATAMEKNAQSRQRSRDLSARKPYAYV